MQSANPPLPIEQRELRGADIVAVREQLGREPTTPFLVVARCAGGHPLVIRNGPLDADGHPFPTTYWLTCPEAVKAVSRIESEGWIAAMNDRIQEDEVFDAAVEAAHRAYAADRARDLAVAASWATSWGGVAGTRIGVKCLHAHYAYHLAGGVDPIGAWVAERVEPVHPGAPVLRVAAIDQGTNSIRLLVVDGAGTELARDMVITRLGEGVDRTGRLDPEALTRTVEVLAAYCRRARALGAGRIRVAATSAVRDADNREVFEAAVLEHAGSPLEVITGEEEAALSYLGATRGLEPADGPFLVQDIGGGSTEFVTGVGPDVAEHAVSTQMGSARLTERHIEHDPPTQDELAALFASVDGVLAQVERDVPLTSTRTFVAVAGTATTLQAINLGLGRYDPDAIHRSWLTQEDAERMLADLIVMTDAERAAIPVMVPGRGDVIIAGAVILVTTMKRFGLTRALVSETDILDGLAQQMLDG
jgi:exopolyphosphatase / guanosine-5'-triphosphate,3'-diphosphate pyrophosphatase